MMGGGAWAAAARGTGPNPGPQGEAPSLRAAARVMRRFKRRASGESSIVGTDLR